MGVPTGYAILLNMALDVFVPDRDKAFYLLRGHLQPLAENVARKFIEVCSAPGDLVIDPFAASPIVARLGLEMGRRAIAVDSNPLVAFASRLQATLPGRREIAFALKRLADLPREGQPLQVHLRQLYGSTCANCGEPVVVDYFVYARGEESDTLTSKVYTCAKCGGRRDPASEADRKRAAEFKPRSLQYHLLLERVLGEETEHTNLMRELLTQYTPRNLYALVSLTLKLDDEFGDDPLQAAMKGCLLHALDVGTSLYASPNAVPERQRPPEFIEVNVWRAFEEAAVGLSEHAPGFELFETAVQVATGKAPAAFVGTGSARALADAVPHESAALVLSSPARLDPGFWEFSFLWTRWLFNKSTAAPLETLLSEKRQRWGWYGAALTNAFADCATLLWDDGSIALAFPSGSHAMIEALMLAASPVAELKGFSFRPQRGARASTEFGALRGDYRVVWRRHAAEKSAKKAEEVGKAIRAESLRAGPGILTARGEPLSYSWLHHAALEQLARRGVLAETMNAKLPERDNAFQFLRHQLEAGLKEGYVNDLDHWQGKQRVLWLSRVQGSAAKSHTPPNEPLAERVARAGDEILSSVPRMSATDFEDSVLERFPGLLTPESELVDVVAETYGRRGGEDWVRRGDDLGAETARARELIEELGTRLNFSIGRDAGPYDMIWRADKVVPGSSGGSIAEAHVVEDAFAIVFRTQLDPRELTRLPAVPLRGLVVIPESQVALLEEKLLRNPILGIAIEKAGWEFLRIPFAEMLLREDRVERSELLLAVGLQPPLAEGKEQMELF